MLRRSLSSSSRSRCVSLRGRGTLGALEDLGRCDGDGAFARVRLGEDALELKYGDVVLGGAGSGGGGGSGVLGP